MGVESSGLLETGPNAHSFEAGVVVQELLVKVGSEVKKGDPLALISTEDLNELIKTAKNELSEANAALLQASGSKDVLVAQNDKNKQDGLDGVKQEYASQSEKLTSEKKRLEASVAQQETALTQIRQQVEESSSKADELQEKARSLKEKINQNILEIGPLNEEVLQAESDAQGQDISAFPAEGQEAAPTAGDPNALRLEITKLQNENTALQQEADAYLADPVFTELEQLKRQQQACEAALKSDREALALKREELERAEKQYQQALENQNDDNAFADYKTGEELKTLDENIAKANRNVQAAQEKVARLEALAREPVLCAQLDGVVTSLNYKAGDTVVDGKPLCVVGELDEISMAACPWGRRSTSMWTPMPSRNSPAR